MIEYTTPETVDDYFNCNCTYYTLRELGYPPRSIRHAQECKDKKRLDTKDYDI